MIPIRCEVGKSESNVQFKQLEYRRGHLLGATTGASCGPFRAPNLSSTPSHPKRVALATSLSTSILHVIRN
jgi:hypothetical protein